MAYMEIVFLKPRVIILGVLVGVLGAVGVVADISAFIAPQWQQLGTILIRIVSSLAIFACLLMLGTWTVETDRLTQKSIYWPTMGWFIVSAFMWVLVAMAIVIPLLSS